jgi:hypothetical protein
MPPLPEFVSPFFLVYVLLAGGGSIFTAVWFQNIGQGADLPKLSKAHGQYWAGLAPRASRHMLLVRFTINGDEI